eukprot:3545362-Prymnesium_polylepis.1
MTGGGSPSAWCEPFMKKSEKSSCPPNSLRRSSGGGAERRPSAAAAPTPLAARACSPTPCAPPAVSGPTSTTFGLTLPISRFQAS